jgi:hypothetical protein
MRAVRPDSGQAAVESALIMPLMVFFTLGIVQLTMIEHAKIMTQYGAYQAARAGIVWNGNNERMHDAALLALAPTMGRTDDMPSFAATWGRAQLYDTALQQLAWGSPVPKTINGSNLLGLVRVDTINPAYFTPIDSIWKLPWGANWKELDFDGPDAYPEVPQLEARIGKFFNLELPDDQEEVYRRSTVLRIRLRYWYELRIPFANWVIFLSWFAANADVALHGAIDRSTLKDENMLNRTADLNALQFQGKGIAHNRGYDSVYPSEMAVLWAIASGDIPILSGAIGGKRFFIPLNATYSMRMQSNFHRKWIMHFGSPN